MVNFDYDCSGWATKANVRCYDGLMIAQDAFKECSGKVVPMVYNHDHANVDNVIGHCLLENRPGGVYCYAKFNDTDTGKTARQCVESGDLSAFSIFANGLKKVGSTVKHGFIREVSLVLAGCNPGALIDEVVKHSADEDYEGGEAFIYNEDGLSLTHGMDPEGNPLEDLTHSADSGDAVTDDEATQEEAKMADEKNEGKTLKQVYNSMTDEQKECCHALVGLALEEQEGGDNDDGEEDDTVKQNVFDKDTNATVLKHSIEEINNVVKTAKSHGTMKAAFEDAGMDSDELAHSIDNIDWLFPEDHLLDTTPRIIDKPDDWVSVVMGAVHHIPFSRFKSMFADLTEELMQNAVTEATRRLEASPAMKGLMQALQEKYGTDANDLVALTEAVRNGAVKDDAYYEKLAMEKGVSTRTARELDKLESQNKHLTEQQQMIQQMERQRAQQARIAELQAGWDREAEQLKAQYPDFNMAEVLANPEVEKMMRSGVSMTNAYRSAYFDHILKQQQAATARQVEQGVVNRMQQRNARPGENGTRPGGAVQTKIDVSHMSRKEMEEMEKRVMRGEVITL